MRGRRLEPRTLNAALVAGITCTFCGVACGRAEPLPYAATATCGSEDMAVAAASKCSPGGPACATPPYCVCYRGCALGSRASLAPPAPRGTGIHLGCGMSQTSRGAETRDIAGVAKNRKTDVTLERISASRTISKAAGVPCFRGEIPKNR
jgi:hypothetical protein